MTLEDMVHAFRLHVLQRAEELGNVSAACREAGISRTVYYRWKKRSRCMERRDYTLDRQELARDALHSWDRSRRG